MDSRITSVHSKASLRSACILSSSQWHPMMLGRALFSFSSFWNMKWWCILPLMACWWFVNFLSLKILSHPHLPPFSGNKCSALHKVELTIWKINWICVLHRAEFLWFSSVSTTFPIIISFKLKGLWWDIHEFKSIIYEPVCCDWSFNITRKKFNLTSFSLHKNLLTMFINYL